MPQYPDCRERRRVHETVRRMINEVVTDVISASGDRAAPLRPGGHRRSARATASR